MAAAARIIVAAVINRHILKIVAIGNRRYKRKRYHVVPAALRRPYSLWANENRPKKHTRAIGDRPRVAPPHSIGRMYSKLILAAVSGSG